MNHEQQQHQQPQDNDNINNNDESMDATPQPYYGIELSRDHSNDIISDDDEDDEDDDDGISSSSSSDSKDGNTNENDDDDDESDVSSEEELMSRLLLGRGTSVLDINYGSIESIVSWIKSGECRSVMILSGAGVSCSAGIPDFRSPGTGLYDNLKRLNLPFPQAVFDLNFYKSNPQPFVTLASELWPGIGKHSPTVTHSFVKLLSDKGLLLRNYTQNIDGLEVLSGVPVDKIMECHGHFRSAKCIECKTPFPPMTAQDLIVKHRRVPICTICGGYVKPDIVFFGEGLPSHMFSLLKSDLAKVDLLIVMGTSLTVAPVSHIPNMIPSSAKRILINRELVGDFCTMENDWDDVFLSGDCDQSVLSLCEKLGWKDELEAVNMSTKTVVPTTTTNQQVETNNNTSTIPSSTSIENEVVRTTLPTTTTSSSTTTPSILNEVRT